MKALALLLLCGGSSAAWFRGGSQSLEGPRRLFEAGQYAQVVQELEPKVQRLAGSEQRQGFWYLGRAHERLGNLDKALGVYQLGVQLYPKDLNLLTELGLLLHRSKLEEQAEPFFQKVLKIHPNNAAAHIGLGEIDHALGFLDRSAEHYEKALETMADHAGLWVDYAEVLISARDYRTAELAARKSLSLLETADARVDLARALRGEGRLDEALAELKTAAAGRPDVAAARAVWLLEAKRYDEAFSAAEALIESDDPPLAAYWVRARVWLKRDRYAAAVDDLRRVASEPRRSPFCAAAAKELLKQLGAS